MSSHPSIRPGLTRLEIVVIIILALTAAGLLLGFLQRQREQALRAQCALHLKQIGDGMFTYMGVKQAKVLPGPEAPLPPSRIADGYATWAVLLAPFLTNDSPLLSWDLKKPYPQQPAEVREAILPVYFCPARVRPSRISQSLAPHPPGGLGDYGAASGDGSEPFLWTGPNANGSIILGNVLEQEGDLILRWRSRVHFGDLVRGDAYTLVFGERHIPPEHLADPAFGDGSIYNGHLPDSFSRVGGPGHPLADSPYTPMIHNFGSYHPGVCQFLYADGRVQALANGIDPEILAKLIRRGP